MGDDDLSFSIKESLIRMEGKIDAILADHEIRIRGIEVAITRMKGALLLVAMLLPIVVALIVTFGPRHHG